MHPLIALWSHPRSMSTAVERLMRERGDIHCCHEPFMYDYYVHRKVRSMPYFEVQEDHPLAYPDIRRMLLDASTTQPVFFKDMAYYVVPQILADEQFLKRLTHVFLLRDLKAAINSYFNLDNDVSCEEIGVEAQFELFSAVRAAGIPTLVVRAESLRKNLLQTFEHIHTHAGVEAVAPKRQWQNDVAKDWLQVQGWHQDVMKSDGLRALDQKTEIEEQVRSQKSFELACQDSPHLQDYYQHHRPFYEALLEQAI